MAAGQDVARPRLPPFVCPALQHRARDGRGREEALVSVRRLQPDEASVPEEYGKGSKLGELPDYKSFEAFEKLDGSMGVLYIMPDGEKAIASRGSFVSDQAKFATEYLNEKYSEVRFLPQYTYLFEIIYPENRIVLDYGNKKEIVLLAIRENHTGRDLKYGYVR